VSLADAQRVLRRFRLRDGSWDMAAPEELLTLADLYRACGDPRSMLGCIYLYTALKHPPPTDCPAEVELGQEVLDAWLRARGKRAGVPLQRVTSPVGSRH
jgi:hypothetical protein